MGQLLWKKVWQLLRWLKLVTIGPSNSTPRWKKWKKKKKASQKRAHIIWFHSHISRIEKPIYRESRLGVAQGWEDGRRWLGDKESADQCWRRGFDPWVRKTPWRKKSLPPPGFLPGESHGQRRMAVHGVTKRWARLSDWARTQPMARVVRGLFQRTQMLSKWLMMLVCDYTNITELHT